MKSFEVKSDPQLWEKLDMDVARFSGMPAMLTKVYTDIYYYSDTYCSLASQHSCQ